MMLLSCLLRCHDVSFSPPVDVVLLLAPTPPPLSVSMDTNDRHRHHTPSYLHQNGSCSFTRHDPYLPSAPASPQTLDRVGCVAVPSAPQPSTRGLPVPESLQPVPWVVICFAINFTFLSSSVAVPGVDQLKKEIKQKAYHVSAYQRITYQSVSGWSRSRVKQLQCCRTGTKKPGAPLPTSPYREPPVLLDNANAHIHFR